MNVKFLGRDNSSADSSVVELSKRKNVRFSKILDPPYFRRVVFRKATKTAENSSKSSRNNDFWNSFLTANRVDQFWKSKFQPFPKQSFVTCTLQKAMIYKRFGASRKVHCNGNWVKINSVFFFSQLTKNETLTIFAFLNRKNKKFPVWRRNWISWVNETILAVDSFTFFLNVSIFL